MVQYFVERLSLHAKENTRITKLKKNNKRKDWMTLELITPAEENNNLYLQTLKFPDNQGLNRRYKDYKNKLITLFDEARVKYFQHQIQGNSKNPNELWKSINSFCNKDKPKAKIKKIITTTNEILHGEEKYC